MRLFLWSLPYFCIIPGLTIYFLLTNYKSQKIKITLIAILILISYSLFNFFSITPYQYTYLNIFNGKNKNGYKKFENDFWGASLKELIQKSNILNENSKLALCGISNGVMQNYINKNKFSKIEIVHSSENYDFIIMTNRTTWMNDMLSWDIKDQDKITNCFEKYKGENLSIVKRNNLVISTIRKSE